MKSVSTWRSLPTTRRRNSRQRPIMLHRALFGSVERFFGVLLEHFAGAFPAWLAPVQARVLPVRDDHQEYASRVADRLRAEGFRADVVEADEPLGGRIRWAKLEKLPYVLVVGDDDVAAGTLGVNPRGGDVERGVAVDAFIHRLHAEVLARADAGERLKEAVAEVATAAGVPKRDLYAAALAARSR